jgi:hypothetical protein
LAAGLKSPLSKRDKARLVCIVDKCIESYRVIRDLQRREEINSNQWGKATKALRIGLHELTSFAAAEPLFEAVIEKEPLFEAVIGVGPRYHIPLDNPKELTVRRKMADKKLTELTKKAFHETADKNQSFLEYLRRVLQATTPKGEPGRPPKYPTNLVDYVRGLRRVTPPTPWKEVIDKCKKRFKKVAYRKPASFKRHMQRLLAE